MNRKTFIWLAFLSLAFVAFAKDKNVSGTYSFVLPSNMTEMEGRDEAVRKAVLQALADEFGTVVTSEVWMDVRNDNEVSGTSLWQLGGSLVKGEWLGDTKPPRIEKTISPEGETVITATVWGKARAITEAKADIDAYLSLPGQGIKQERFADGSRFTLSLKSAEAGHVSVYLSDENGDVCRLLPFAMDDASTVRVNPMQQYEFFTSQHGIEEQYLLQTNEKRARNIVYVVFSKQPYTRPLDSYYANRSLRILSRASFLDWLGRQKLADVNLNVLTLPVEIIGK